MNEFTISSVNVNSFIQSIDGCRQDLGSDKWSKGERKGWFYQTTKDEEDHKQAPQGGFCIDIPVAHCRHCHHQQIDTFPIGKWLGILEVFPRIPWVFHLKRRWEREGRTIRHHSNRQFVNRVLHRETISSSLIKSSYKCSCIRLCWVIQYILYIMSLGYHLVVKQFDAVLTCWAELQIHNVYYMYWKTKIWQVIFFKIIIFMEFCLNFTVDNDGKHGEQGGVQ